METIVRQQQSFFSSPSILQSIYTYNEPDSNALAKFCVFLLSFHLSSYHMCAVPRNAAMLIELSASSSRTPAATLSLQLANHYDG